MTDVYLFRQCLSLVGSVMYSLSCGFALSFPSVLNLAITSQNSTDIQTTEDHATWIAASNGVGGILGAFILSPIMDFFGRIIAMCLISAFLSIGWIIMSLAKNILALYAARLIQGISVCNVYILCIIFSEYIHPTRRAYFITIKKVTIALGVFFCHGMSMFCTWRQTALFAALPPILSIGITVYLPESPSYLAMTGKFAKCEQTYKWMMGSSLECQRELTTLIETQKSMNNRSMISKYTLSGLWKTFVAKDFQKQFLISSLISLVMELCGRYFIVAYAIQIMKSLVATQTSALYFTLGADLFVIIALTFSTFIVKRYQRRMVLFSSGVSAVVLMFLISILVYLNTVFSFPEYYLWAIALILIIQCFVVNLGLIPVSFTLVSEIFKLEYKGLAITLSDLVFTFLNALFLKVTPILMDRVGMHGTYGIFGVIMVVCLWCLHKTVPETKDKTLLEIEFEMNNGKVHDVKENQLLKP